MLTAVTMRHDGSLECVCLLWVNPGILEVAAPQGPDPLLLVTAVFTCFRELSFYGPCVNVKSSTLVLGHLSFCTNFISLNIVLLGFIYLSQMMGSTPSEQCFIASVHPSVDGHLLRLFPFHEY